MSTTAQRGAVGEIEPSTPAAPLAPLVEMQGLAVKFGNREILRGLTATLRGRSIGLLGPNGAGKSTLINTLLGFYEPAKGTARVFGHDVRADVRRVRSLGRFGACIWIRRRHGSPQDSRARRIHA